MKRNIILIGLIVVAATVFSSCKRDLLESNVEEQPLSRSSVFGYVLNHDNQPIEGVLIEVENYVVYTDVNGYFELKNFPYQSNQIILKIQKDGYYSTSIVNSNPTKDFKVNIKLEKVSKRFASE